MKGITKEKKIIAGVLVAIVLVLTVAFAAVSQSLKINGTAKVDSALWDIHFKSAEMIDKKGDAREVEKPLIDNGGIDLTLKVGLRKPKDEITYEAVIVNAGDMDAQIERIDYPKLTEDQAKILEFIATYDTGMTLLENQSLKAKEEIKVIITVRFKDITDESLLATEAYDIPLTFKINYIQSGFGAPAIDRNAESILAEGTDGGGTSKFFGGPITKESVEKIKFMPTVKASSDAIDSWDASYKKDGSVIAWYTDADSNDLYELYIGGYGKVYAPVDSGSLFRNFNKVTEIDFGNVFDTSNVTTMFAMFYGCTSLIRLDVSNFNTSPVTNMRAMFSGCLSLTNLEGSSFNTVNVTNMTHMFYNCTALKTLDLSSFNVEKVTHMNNMFYNCTSLTSLDVSNFNPINVITMQSMFYSCTSLTNLDLSSFNTLNTATMEEMFKDCKALETLDISNFNPVVETGMPNMFYGCSSLKSINMSNFNSSNVTTLYQTFYGCSSLLSLDLSSFNIEKVTNMNSTFYNCTALKTLDVSNFNPIKVITMRNMFYNCASLITLDLSSFDTSKVTNMSGMFNGCTLLTNLDLSHFNTSNVVSMAWMFENCESLASLNVDKFNTSKVTDVEGMFQGCSSLTSLNLSSFNTEKVTNMLAMFSGCSSLASLDVSNFNTSNVTSMKEMFANCSSLISIDLSSFNTSKVTGGYGLYGMFWDCTKLESIDLRNADFASIANTNYTFSGTNSLKVINLSNVTVDKYSVAGFKTFITGLGSSKTIYVKDSDCVTAGQSINANLNYVVYSA